MHRWSPASWRQSTSYYNIPYPDSAALRHITHCLQTLPALISIDDLAALKTSIAKAARGEHFIVQGGDCAESFADAQPHLITQKVQQLHQLRDVLHRALQKPVVCIGRIAGQYAKSRSSMVETHDGLSLPSYFGDLINSTAFDAQTRCPNPQRLLLGYQCAAKTITALKKAVYTSHEALHLDYEQALTRQTGDGAWYNTSTHLPWLGVRTSQLDGAHVEFLRGIQNPIGIKIGPQTTPEHCISLLLRLNPPAQEGRILFITRLGAQRTPWLLPDLIHAVQATQIPVTWLCDPMHGNTEMTAHGIKTRQFEAILQELTDTDHIHQNANSHLGGVHLELTPQAVTECLGGTEPVMMSDLIKNYQSTVDPRLNGQQALDLIHHFKR